MRLLTGYAVATSLALAIPAIGVSTSAEANWMRERVEQFQRRMTEHFLGREAADRLHASPKIIGGIQAPPGAWPFQAGILNAALADNFDAQFCGASVVGSQFVLTAAHCLDFLTGPSQIHVLVKTQSLEEGGVRMAVDKFKIHRRWGDDPTNPNDYDVAVIKTKQQIAIRASKRASFISSLAQESSFAPVGEQAKTIGWGDTDPGGGTTFPTELREVVVPIVKRTTCNGPDSYNGDITKRMLCAGFAAGGKDSCQGDSGGPLVVRNNDNKYRLQVGVVSWGIGCALPDFYGVYTRLGVLGTWVADTIAKLQ